VAVLENPTSAPEAAVNDKALSSSVFSGNTTLPVSRNITTKVITAMTVSTSGNREVMASAVSRFTWATPVTKTC
jgi:hypothetical protein